MENNVRIRVAQDSDLEPLLVLYQQLHLADEPLPEADIVRGTWGEILSDPKMQCFIADLNGEVVASCVLVVVPNLTRGARPYGLIENVVTHASYRHQGIGTTLLRHALRAAWSQNCYKVMLLTGSKRDEVHQFYEQAGFIKGDKTGFIARP